MGPRSSKKGVLRIGPPSSRLRPLLLAAAAAATALVLALAPAAHAATVSIEGDTLRLAAGPFETNAVTIHADPLARASAPCSPLRPLWPASRPPPTPP